LSTHLRLGLPSGLFPSGRKCTYILSSEASIAMFQLSWQLWNLRKSFTELKAYYDSFMVCSEYFCYDQYLASNARDERRNAHKYSLKMAAVFVKF
jgi:hypothetical protein